MKKFFFSILFTLAFGGSLLAQSPEKISKGVSREIVKRTEIMKLDDTQKEKVKEILTIYYTDRTAARKLEGAERKSQMKAASKKFNDSMSSVCTKEQLSAWKQYQKEKASKKNK